MTLSDNPTEPPTPADLQAERPQQLERKKKGGKYPPKLAAAIEIAKKHTDLSYPAARNRIMEETPCSKSIAHKAYHLLKNQNAKQKEATEEKTAQIQIVHEPDTNAAFLPKEQPRQEGEPETLEPITEPNTQQLSEAQQEQLDLFKDMLRSMYVMVFSKEGVLGDKYGRSKQACENLADMQYRWLLRRYDVADLERFDTVLLVGAYGTLFAGIAKDYMEERNKKKAEKRAE